METSLIGQGLDLMLVGMGTVFTFLTILVFAMQLMSKLLSLMVTGEVNGDISDHEVAAISAAIDAHRRGD